MLTRLGRASRLRAAVLVGTALLFAPGCSLIPTWDDIDTATSYVKDTMSGKAKRDRQTQAFAEARIMERRQDFAGAEKLYRELLTEKPDSRDCYHRLAVIASVQSKFPEASALYQQALACGSPTPDLWNDVGYCHYLQHQMPEAEGAFRQALGQAPQHRAALNNLAMTLGEQGNFDEAYRLFRQGNSEAEAEANFAFLCAQCGDLPRAQQHYSRALSSNPELKNAVDGLFQVTERMQKIQLAQARQQQSDPNLPNGVQLVSHDGTPQFQPPKPLIEVFTASSAPRASTAPNASAIPAAAAPNAGNVQQTGGVQPNGGSQQPGGVHQAGGAQPPATPAAPPTQPTMLYNTPTTPGGLQPYSFQQPPQPQYLQPTTGPRTAQQGGPPPNAVPTMNQPSTSVLNAGGPFPPLVGGASANR